MNDNISNKYFEMKAKHPDVILLYRIGDFYESYGDDAVALNDVLGVTLIHRNTNSIASKLAGFHWHKLDTYLPKLVRACKRVAICEGDTMCNNCRFYNGYCNRLVSVGGLGMNDKVASDYLRDGKCEYFEQGESEQTNQPTFYNS